MAAFDQDDPCATAVALRKVYYDTLAGGGGQVVSVRFGDREVKYDAGAGGLDRLRADMLAAETACDLKNGVQPKRRAIKFGNPFGSNLG
jgi:hypothetical protein